MVESYNGPSKYGIHESRVRKLTVWSESERQKLGLVADCMIDSDRGRSKKPAAAFNELLEAQITYLRAISFENLKKRIFPHYVIKIALFIKTRRFKLVILM